MIIRRVYEKTNKFTNRRKYIRKNANMIKKNHKRLWIFGITDTSNQEYTWKL